MSKEIKKVEEIENVTEEEVEVTETKQKFGSKIVGWGKKHGKKIVTGVVIAAVGVLGYALGKKDAGEGEEYFEDEVDSETFDAEFEEVDPE